jgi:hypothetical protein
MASKLAKGMEDSIQKRIEEIKKMPLPEIRNLLSFLSEEVKIENKTFTLAVWKNQRADGIIEIIVQAYYTGLAYKLIGAGMIAADGFLIDDNGKILKLPNEIRWEYC